jgi:ArsR family transcriptional regulator
MEAFTRIFKALSDATRLRILLVLREAGKDLCICEIMDALQLPQYHVSRHMKELKVAGLVRESRRGRFIFYALTGPENGFQQHIREALGGMDDDTIRADRSRLQKRLALREGDTCIIGMKRP